MFNYTENITLPKLSDVINTSSFPINFMQVFTYAWVWFLGGWFFAGVIGVLGAALYMKYDNVMVPVAFFVLMMVFLGPVMNVEPIGPIPSAEGFVYLIGLFAAFAIGITLYMLFISKRE